MSLLSRQAEVRKCARVLGAPPAELDYLLALSPEQLRGLRRASSAALFDAQRKRFAKLAKASRLLPNAANAVISEKVMGPKVCARVAGLLEPSAAVDLAKRLPVPFQADICQDMDPRAARDMLQKMPHDIVVAVALCLRDRGEYITMAQFVDDLPDAAIEAVSTELDPETLLRVGLYVESPDRLSDLIGLYGDDQLRDILRIAAFGDADLWPEALQLMTTVAPDVRRRMGVIASQEDEAWLESLVEAVDRHHLWGAALIVTADMAAVAQHKLAAVPWLEKPETVAHIQRAADTEDLWREAFAILPQATDSARDVAAHHLAGMSADAIARALHATHEHQLWATTLDLFHRLDDAGQKTLATVLDEQSTELVVELFEVLTNSDVPGDPDVFLGLLHADTRTRVEEARAQLG